MMMNKQVATQVTKKRKVWKRLMVLGAIFSSATVVLMTALLAANRFRQARFTPVDAPRIKVSTNQPRLTQVAFTGVAPILPESFSSFTAGGETLSLDEKTKKMAEVLQMTYQSDRDVWEREATNEVLYRSTSDSRIRYVREERGSLLTQPGQNGGGVGEKKLPSDEEIRETALEFLRRFELPILPDAASARLEFYAGELDLFIVEREKAQFARVFFSLSLDTYPLFVDSGFQDPFVVLVSADKQVVSADLGSSIPTPVKEGVLQPKPIEIAVEELRQNRGIMVRAEVVDLETGIFEIRRLRSVTFDRVVLEYRYVSESGRFYPFYHFYGDAQTATGDRGKLEMIVPAYLPVAGV